MHYSNDENVRVSKLYLPSSLKDKTVTIIGCGAGGEVAFRLMQSGVRKINLVDFDTLESHNLIRHICGSPFIGQKKVEAVKNLLTQYNPDIQVNTFDIDIMDEWATLCTLTKESDLLICLTDTDKSRFYINEAVSQYQKPAVYGALYDENCGGEIFWYKPQNACYTCFRHEVGSTSLINEYKNAKNKKDCASNHDPIQMPGLGIDQGIFLSIFSRICLELLLTNIPNKLRPLLDPVSNCLIFSITGIGQFEPNNLSSYYTRIQKNENCFFCS